MAKKTRLPDDFEVTQHMIELAKAKGWPDPRTEVEAFKDYHLAHGSLMLDWQACFRTWLRNAQRFGRGAGKLPNTDGMAMSYKPTFHDLKPLSDDQIRENQRRINQIITGLAARKGIR